jgi:hypothetical protein
MDWFWLDVLLARSEHDEANRALCRLPCYLGYLRCDIRSNDMRAAVTVKAAAT